MDGEAPFGFGTCRKYDQVLMHLIQPGMTYLLIQNLVLGQRVIGARLTKCHIVMYCAGVDSPKSDLHIWNNNSEIIPPSAWQWYLEKDELV
jgi:hypothetical protein